MPKVTIDGVEIEVAEGKTVLQAALSRGKEIPHYCYHEGLSIAGNCRMCLVEIEKAPKLAIGCSTPVMDGMVVHTQSEKVKEAQAAVMEFLLINHPLDCPICDQAGECRLQEYAVEHGTGVSRYTESKQLGAKAVDIGEHIMLDQERCIQCSRCTRFCDEVTGTSELAFFQRGSHNSIGTFPGKRLDNAYSGNVADICPVGALTTKEFRFQTRVWYLKNTPSICAGCSRGCNVMVATGKQQELMTTQGQLDDRIKRIVPRVNEAVNGHWICDEGRLSYQKLAAGTRMLGAQAPQGQAVAWDDAVARMGDALKSAADAGRLAAIVSPRLTSETMLAWKRTFDGLGQVKVGVVELIDGQDDDLLVRADKGANARGADWIFPGHTDDKTIVESIARGEVDTLLVLGDVLDPADTVTLDDAAFSKLKQLLHVGPFEDAVAARAALLLPVAAWAEEDGTMVNFEGHVQRVQRAHRPTGEGRPGWRVAVEVAAAAGVDLPDWTEAGAVLSELSEGVEAYNGMDESSIGLLGRAGAVGVS